MTCIQVATFVFEPESFEAAIQEEAWKNEIEEEINVIEKNETWELVGSLKTKMSQV